MRRDCKQKQGVCTWPGCSEKFLYSGTKRLYCSEHQEARRRQTKAQQFKNLSPEQIEQRNKKAGAARRVRIAEGRDSTQIGGAEAARRYLAPPGPAKGDPTAGFTGSPPMHLDVPPEKQGKK